jgi:hypothetical protein
VHAPVRVIAAGRLQPAGWQPESRLQASPLLERQCTEAASARAQSRRLRRNDRGSDVGQAVAKRTLRQLHWAAKSPGSS